MNPVVPNELLVAIARGDGIPFVGSGPSITAGFPGWRQLIELMLDWCVNHAIDLPNKSDIEHLIKSTNFLLAADALRANMGEIQYHEFLREVFDQPSAPLTEFHQLLPQIPFAGAATTNYETLVERTFRDSKPEESIEVFTHVDHEQLGTVLHSKQFFVVKAHGTIERPETIVLGKKDYAALIHTSVSYRTFLKALFLGRSVLFLGFGLNDPELLLLLEELLEIFEGHTPIHHALIDVSHTTETEQKSFESYYGIRIIPYTPSSPDHPEVTEFLRQILAKLPKYILAHAMNHALKPVKGVLDADSHYRLVMNSDNKFTIEEKYPGASKEKPLAFSMQFDREAHEALKKLFSTGEPVTIRSPHLAKFVAPDVLSVLMPERFDEMQVSMGPVVGDKSITVRAIFETNDGERVELQNIELKNIQSGTEQMILSNEHQDVPWKFREVIRFDEKESQANFTFDSINMPISQAVKGLKFCRAFSKGGSLKLESVETDLQLSRAEIPAGSYPSPSENWMRICEAIELIQRKTGTLFKSPDAVKAEDARGIAIVVQILETGKATMMPPVFDVAKAEAQNLLSKSSAEKPLSLTNYADEWVSVILGHRVSLGPVLITGEKLHVAPDDAEEVEQKLESNRDRELIPVRLTPVAGSALDARYPQWLPKEEAEIVLRTVFVRKTSLSNLINSLFVAAKDQTGAFDPEEFVTLLKCAQAASLEEGILINPLKTETPDDISEAIEVALSTLDDDTCSALRARLSADGWSRERARGASPTGDYLPAKAGFV